jgi:hypothetical protein
LGVQDAFAAVVPMEGRVFRQEHAQIDGTLTMRIMVFALARPDNWIEVTSGVREIVLPLSGGAPSILTRKELPAGRYAAIRTVFLHVEALVEGGLTVDGVPIRGPVRVELGPEGRVIVETPPPPLAGSVDFTIAQGRDSRIKVDLHTNRWIRLLNAQRQVRSQDFAGEVKVGRQP